jgi:mono/diheme cytochrome c family protein
MSMLRHTCFFTVALGLFFLPTASPGSFAKQPGPLDVEPEDVRAGLLGVYTSLVDKEAILVRVDNQPALAWGHASPHLRLPAGPLEVIWTGLLLVKDAGPLSFEAFVGGDLTLKVDGVTVLEGRGDSDRARLKGREKLSRSTGLYRLEIRYRTLPDVAARLQIRWEGPTFGLEPIPPWHFKHLAQDLSEKARQEEQISQGRRIAGKLGCARCHAEAFPGVTEPPPGPSLADVGQRVSRDWLLRWLEEPGQVLHGARMPALFSADRQGFTERWLVAEYLGTPKIHQAEKPLGDHREGRKTFLSIGCVACHQVPDMRASEQADLDRWPLRGLTQRFPGETLAAFLANPHGRYLDGRMPRLPLSLTQARDMAAYLLLWSESPELAGLAGPSSEEIQKALSRLKARDKATAGAALVQEKKCGVCHPGLGSALPAHVPLTSKSEGCLAGKTLPRFDLDACARQRLQAFVQIARQEKYPSSVANRQQLLERSGCVRCHARDTDRPPPLEVVGSTIGGAYLQYVPFQRTPRLTHLHQKYTPTYLASAIREGVAGLRPGRYSYRMPAFGSHTEALVQALAEADGDLSGSDEPVPSKTPDPTLASLTGPNLVGFQGYACVACHIWNGQALSNPDPGAVGPDLIHVANRLRRDWFDRFLENPARFHPGTPMPAVFTRGKPATLPTFLDGDPIKQKDALWHYFALGKDAPNPKPPPPLVVQAPSNGSSPLVSQVPLRMPDNKLVESITVLFATNDLVIYDLATAHLHSLFTGGQILRHGQGRIRTYQAMGNQVTLHSLSPWQLFVEKKAEEPTQVVFEGYDALPDGVRLRSQIHFPSGRVTVADSFRLGEGRNLQRELHCRGLAPTQSLQVAFNVPKVLTPNKEGQATATLVYDLPPAQAPALVERTPLADPGKMEGSLARPGYKAIAYPRPKTPWGEDLLMPSAVAVNPRNGRVFIASMKLGEIFVLRDPTGDGSKAHYDNYGRGLFQEAYSLLAEEDALYVLHRRNLTKILDTNGDGQADRFDRLAGLPHGIGETYDYGYGLVRDRTGAFVFSYAPYANRQMPGSGGAVRLHPGKKAQEIAFGFRNPVGWCVGPEGEVFFTDNQGEWVATNKLCHLEEGKFYGFPNPEQKQHTEKPRGKTTIWVPYDWARSINGVTYDNTGGKFGPFAGQIFLAELMYGGAILRANLEKVNGVYQGACFPFWGKGLLGPLTMAFDPKGRLFVGSITEPGWMAQPDRGALYRLDYTGQTPFEIQSLHVLPRGFRMVFTTPIAPETAQKIASYHIEHYRYEHTGSYGSPELDRARLPIEKINLASDGRSVDINTGPLLPERVYMITAAGVRSVRGESLVHPTGAYTLNEIPPGKN